MTASAVTSPTSAVSFSWAITGPCSPSISSITATSSAVATIQCCSVYTFYCWALNSSNVVVGTGSIASSMNCPPVVTITGSTGVCTGQSAFLLASGAQSYTWSNGFIGSGSIVSPTSSTTYSVIGLTTAGCTGSAITTVTITPNAVAGFTYSQGPAGQVSFTNTTYNSGSNTYTWNFGGGQPLSYLANPTTTYSSNGPYTVSLTSLGSCGGITSANHVVQISSLGPSCVAGFSVTSLGNGQFNFTSTSTGTNSGTIYQWDYGDNIQYSGTGAGGAHPPPHTYSTSGTYTVLLTITTGTPACIDSASSVLSVTVCNLNIGFTTQQTGIKSMDFFSSGTSTLAGATFTWSYGDNSFGYGPVSSHNYNSAGTYLVRLSVLSGGCFERDSQLVHVIPCSLHANFTHTLGSNGVAHFSNTSTLTGPTNYYWDFGDGVFSLASSPTHTYNNAGTYFVTLTEKDSLRNYCRDTTMEAINVTGISCVANASFMISPAGNPQYWNAIPSYPWNVTASNWTWGDGTTSNSLYTSHQYSLSGTYTICLSVTVSCGATASYCHSYYFNKDPNITSPIISVNVTPPDKTNGILILNGNSDLFKLYPNPNDGHFSIEVSDISEKTSLAVYNLIGETVYTSDLTKGDNIIALQGLSEGVYFACFQSGVSVLTRKIVIRK